jgi:hypothetical protein
VDFIKNGTSNVTLQTTSCPFHFKLSNLPSQITSLHYENLFLKKLLVELCLGNYETLNNLVNGADGIFENFIENISKSLV